MSEVMMEEKDVQAPLESVLDECEKMPYRQHGKSTENHLNIQSAPRKICLKNTKIFKKEAKNVGRP